MFNAIQKICFIALGLFVIHPVFAQESAVPQDVQEAPVVDVQDEGQPEDQSPDDIQSSQTDEEHPAPGSETEPCVACGMG